MRRRKRQECKKGDGKKRGEGEKGEREKEGKEERRGKERRKLGWRKEKRGNSSWSYLSDFIHYSKEILN